jgi:hypothetical protein
MGQKRSKGMSIAEAVKMFGGPQLVMSRELLWEESAQQAMTGQLERWYMFLSMLLTTALYVVAITVWRALPGKPRAASAKKPAAATPPSPPEEQP